MRLWFLLLLGFPSYLYANTYFGQHEEGWFWYKDKAKELKSVEKVPVQTTLDPNLEMQQYREKIDRSLNNAILHPTEENLRHYANQYFEVARRAQNFTDAYKIMLLKHPQYDYYLKFPVSHNARNIHDRQQADMIDSAIQKLSASHGFFFFFSSGCDYCRLFAPTVKKFSEQYHIDVMAISLDGGSLAEFPNAVRDNGTAKALGVTSWPALFAVNPKTKQVMPLTNGAVSVDDLRETVFRYAEFEKKGIQNEP